ASFEQGGRDWGKVATLPAAGTGPFRIAKVVPRQFVELTRNEGHWDPGHKANVGTVRLAPMPEANTRLAALRSGQVDWIEVPPPDGIPSLKAAGFTIVTNSYPHVWPWLFNMGATNSPVKDVRVRQGLNYCIDRAGLVTLLNAARMTPDAPGVHGAMALNASSPSSDVGVMARYFLAANASPNGFNFEQWNDPAFEAAFAALAAATDPAVIEANFRKAHERL